MSGFDWESVTRPALGIGLLLLTAVLAIGAGISVAVWGITRLPDALVAAGLVGEVTTPVVAAAAVAALTVAGAVMLAVFRVGLTASNALGDYLGFDGE